MESRKLPKISVVMQSYLKDYEGSRINAVDKFIRVVNSFKAQTYSKSELIIVADGCDLTLKTYKENFEKDPNIKIVYIDRKSAQLMYSKTNGVKYYRGYPRSMGVAAATGDIITYVDSDDFLMPDFLMYITILDQKYPGTDWFMNVTWYDNVIGMPEEHQIIFDPEFKTDPIIINGLEGEWVRTKLKPDLILMSPGLFCHKSYCDTKWIDTVEVSEDVTFSQKLREKYTNGMTYEAPTYVRCHVSDRWDF
jgi:glycosyltransferase involved in cell wall biosynthesis